MRNKSLLLGALAAFAYYKYSRMSKEDKDNLVSNLKEKGRQFMDQLVPGGIGQRTATSGTGNSGNTRTGNEFVN